MECSEQSEEQFQTAYLGDTMRNVKAINPRKKFPDKETIMTFYNTGTVSKAEYSPKKTNNQLLF